MFSACIAAARQILHEGGYGGATLEILLTRDEAMRVQRELDLALLIVDEALRPNLDDPGRAGARLFAVVGGVRVYVREDAGAPLDLNGALALTDAIERNGGEDPFDLELNLEQTRKAVSVIRSLVAQSLGKEHR